MFVSAVEAFPVELLVVTYVSAAEAFPVELLVMFASGTRMDGQGSTFDREGQNWCFLVLFVMLLVHRMAGGEMYGEEKQVTQVVAMEVLHVVCLCSKLLHEMEPSTGGLQ